MVTSELGIAKVFHGAQTALFAALSDGHGYSQGKAYRAAGYLAKPGASADSAASSRLRKFKGILDRVRELVAEANARNQHNVDLSRERIGRDLDHAANAVPNASESQLDFKNATSMHDIGRKLLMTVGMENPPLASIELAIEATHARLNSTASRIARV